jgi:hypothetical protein
MAMDKQVIWPSNKHISNEQHEQKRGRENMKVPV